MSNERDQPATPDPHDHVATFTYDPCGRPPSSQPGASNTIDYRCGWTGQLPAAQPRKPAASATAPCTPCRRHCFEFRLCGSERQQQSLALDGCRGAAPIAAIERLRAFLTGAGPSAAAASAIGGIEVYLEAGPGGVVCTAQLSDFKAGDLVVVQVDVAVYTLGVPGQS